MKGHFIVCGMGHVGYRVVDLLGRLGETVTVITQSARAEWLHAVQARGVQVRIGDAQDERLLVEAGVREAQAVLAVTPLWVNGLSMHSHWKDRGMSLDA